MNLVRFSNPHYKANRVLVDELFNNFFKNDYHENYSCVNASEPATNVFETEKEFKLEVVLPGFSKKDLSLSAQNNLLTIKVEKEEEKSKEELRYSRKEFSTANFEKQYRLPKSIEIEKISAKFENGVLRVELPKKEEALEKAPVEINIS